MGEQPVTREGILMKDLTLRYSVTQATFWAASTGASSVATAYLLGCGIPPGTVGILLAAAGLLSCLTQPLLAGLADRTRQFLLLKLMLGMSLLCVVCFAVQLIPRASLTVVGSCYMLTLWSADTMVPFINALCISYTQAGFPIHYAAARGIGSAASALSSLVFGFVVARLGRVWMLLLLIALRLSCIPVLCGYPGIGKSAASGHKADGHRSILAFLSHYRWYCASLVGILFLGMYHAMTENYMIAIVERLGGDSSSVGTALFLSAMVASPVIFFFEPIHARLSDALLLKIAACSFLLKAVLFYFAKSIAAIYLL